MSAADQLHSDNLRAALLALDPAGPDGFEGLLAVVLGRVLGQPFRLASSGTQRGRDGDSAFDQGATYFEGKRYDKGLGKADIAGKIFDLRNDDAGQVDLWVLGVTSEVPALTAADAYKGGEQIGIGVYILDWSDTDLGGLIVCIAAAGEAAKDFIRDKLSAPEHADLIPGALAAIDHFAAHADFASRVASLKVGLSAQTAALGLAKAGNGTWLRRVFESRRRARSEFGQPLAPLDPTGRGAKERKQSDDLRNAFVGNPVSELYVVLGDEGVGKSWLIAQTWLDTDPRSILVICTADEIPAMLASGITVDDFLVRKLIQQTDGSDTEPTRERWRRRFRMWRQNPKPDNVRLTLVIDGLNQTLDADWVRLIDGFALRLQDMGGCLVVTTRTSHWARIRSSLASKVTRVPVVNWSAEELSELLRSRGINPDVLSADVFAGLRNPRISGIALDLLEAKDIETFEELNVPRLMFEHMRRAENTGTTRLSGQEFARLLQDLAQEVMTRAESQQSDDLRIFNAGKRDDLRAAASSQFFSPVTYDPDLYKIHDRGLDLGLALWLIRALERELDNGRQPAERLVKILEPMSALDETADIVLYATQIAILQDDVSSEVRATLIEHVASLQNLPDTEADSFAALVKSAPEAFLLAAERVYASSTHFPNADWMLYALLKYRDDGKVWASISSSVKEWLAYYSLAPERMMFKSSASDNSKEVEEERSRRQSEIDKKIENLTQTERAFVDANLSLRPGWSYDGLQRVGLFLLAGKPLAEFAPHLWHWAFADALAPSFQSAEKDFRNLLRFNSVDWKETRNELLRLLEEFDGQGLSDVVKWARVEILGATGVREDAEEAEKLATWLTRDREKFSGWSLLQKYCASDPCDPASEMPDNVIETATTYREIQPDGLATNRAQGSENHFFNMARPGVARFRLEDALTPHRRLAEHVLGRLGEERKNGILALRPHSAAMERQTAARFLKAGQETSARLGSNERDRDEWITAQFSFLLALPHLTADEQLAALERMDTDTVLLDILAAMSPAAPDKVESALVRITASNDEHALARVLGAIQYSQPKLTSTALEIVAGCLAHSNELVRFQALGICANSGDKETLTRAVASGWIAGSGDGNGKHLEDWYGSRAMLEAARQGIITLDDALDRIGLGHFGFAAVELGPDVAKIVGRRVVAAIERALGLGILTELPDIELQAPKMNDPGPPRVSLHELVPDRDTAAQMERLNESAQAFDERQKRIGRAYDRFKKELTSAEANLILEDLTLEGTFAILDALPEIAPQLLAMLTDAKDHQLRHLHHLAIQVGIWSVIRDAGPAEALLRRALSLRPTVRRVEGFAKLPSEIAAIWEHAANPICKAICSERLLSLDNDRDISLEVLAATKAGMGRILEDVVDSLLATGQPAGICRALTIAGFRQVNPHSDGVLGKYADAKGYIGTAAKAAQGAYDRSAWAQYWLEAMKMAETPEEFWRASVLFSKLIDARLDLCLGTIDQATICGRFWISVRTGAESRIEKWHNKRKEKLFGDGRPASVFLP